MGNKSKYSSAENNGINEFFDQFVKTSYIPEELTEDTETSLNSAQFCFDSNGENFNVNLNKDGEYVLIDPRFLAGEVSEKNAKFCKLTVSPSDSGSDIHAEEITFNQMLSHFDESIDPKKSDYELRKNVVLWNKLGFDSLKDKVYDSIEKVEHNVKKPHRGFWGTIRDWFGKDNDGRKKYEREKEVYRARVSSILESKYEVADLKYDAELLDDAKANAYINGTPLEEIKKDVKPVREKKEAASVDKMWAKNADAKLKDFVESKNPQIAEGAKAISDLLKAEPNSKQSQAVLNFLNLREKAIKNASQNDIKKYTDEFERLCITTGKNVATISALDDEKRNNMARSAISVSQLTDFAKDDLGISGRK